MAITGQKFTLDLDADNFQFDIHDADPTHLPATPNVVGEIKEREPTEPPPPPKTKSKSGFPEHRSRPAVSRFKQRQNRADNTGVTDHSVAKGVSEPSDRAIAHHIGQKYGFDTEAKEKAQISEENKQKLAQMSVEEIEQARAELLSGLNPALVQRLLGRANIDEDQAHQTWEDESLNAEKERLPKHTDVRNVQFQNVASDTHQEVRSHQEYSSAKPSEEQSIIDQDRYQPMTALPTDTTMHFPVPPRDAAAFPNLDPNSATFLEDLRSHYFPDTPHDPHGLSWLQDPTDDENKASAYAPTQHAYAPSDIRFDFTGCLIPPSESEAIPNSQGLHHHGDAPNSAGYTIPELAMLCRSSLPNQRCIAYQTLGRILYRLGRGDFGAKGTELNEGLWACVEHERPIEVIMAEANRQGRHLSAKTYATEALWLWRKGGGGDRGVLKEGQKIVR